MLGDHSLQSAAIVASNPAYNSLALGIAHVWDEDTLCKEDSSQAKWTFLTRSATVRSPGNWFGFQRFEAGRRKGIAGL